jgi:diguanylate cyclase (GGDEF)-like protein
MTEEVRINFYKIALVYWVVFALFELLMHSIYMSGAGAYSKVAIVEAILFISGIVLTILAKNSLKDESKKIYDEQYERKIRDLASRSPTMGSDEYFSVLTKNIIDAVGCDYVVIGQINYTDNTSKPYITTKSARGRNREYLQTEVLLKTSNCQVTVQDIEDADLSRIFKGKKGRHINMPLVSSDNDIHGILSCIWIGPDHPPKTAKNVLKIFSTQCQSELERLLTEEKLKYQATHDELTGLPNRNFVMEKLKGIVTKYNSGVITNKTYNVYFIDLDDFKEVNDEFGHDAGDQLLVEISRRLESCVREEDTVARLGGDEFVIVEAGSTNVSSISLSDRIINKLQQAVNLHDNVSVTVTASVGHLCIPEDSQDVTEIFKYADFAMYYAKSLGKNVGVKFTQELFRDCQQEKVIEGKLISAIENKEIDMAIQPIVDHNQKIVKGEVLARWFSDDISLTIEDVINIAERRGLIVAFSKHIFEKSAEYCSELKFEHGIYARLAVNCSPLLFKDPEFVPYISSVFDKYNISPKQITLEITESVASKHKEILPTIVDLKSRGFELALDDFGKGYSSLSFLETLPIDVVKLDRALVTDAIGNKKKSTLLKAVAEICKVYEYKLVAEGIETKKDFEFLKKLGYDWLQGYYFSRPVPSEEYTKLLTQEK